jgi:pectin methylesterase-like acyl-CoA thioesterase
MLRNPSRRRSARTEGPRRHRPAVEPLEGRLALALTITALTPAAGAAGVCIDTPLTIAFNQAPMLGTGNIVVHNAADGSVVDTVAVTPGMTGTVLPNLVAGAVSQHTIGGSANIAYYQVFIDTAADTATIYLHQTAAQSLAYGQSYYVTMDAGTFTDAAGDQSSAITDPSAWQFTTKASAPPAGTAMLTVAADGSGDFCTVQGAINFVPANNTQRVFILVRKGTYTEIDNVASNKPFITIYGEDRNQTVIQYPNNNTFQAQNNPGGGHTNNRYLFNDEASDFALANITLHNITPQNGSQAEAFRSNGQRVVLDGVNLLSLQDTLLDNTGSEYIVDSFIAGNVDYIWGSGAGFFQNDEIQTVGGTSMQYISWPRSGNGATATAFAYPGFVFVGCRFTRSDASVTNTYLARNDPRPGVGWPYSQMVLINCQLAPNIVPIGWYPYNASISPPTLITSAPNVRYWEYNSTDPSGNPIDTSQRAFFSSQMSRELARRWSNPSYVLLGWTPNLGSVLPPGLQVSTAGPAQ